MKICGAAFGDRAESAASWVGLGSLALFFKGAHAFFEFFTFARFFKFELFVPHSAEDDTAGAGADSFTEVAALETCARHKGF